MDQRRNERDQGLQRARIGLPDFNGDRLARGRRRRAEGGARCIGFVELSAQVLQYLGGAFQGAGAAVAAPRKLWIFSRNVD